jgi:hypothetical protein
MRRKSVVLFGAALFLVSASSVALGYDDPTPYYMAYKNSGTWTRYYASRSEIWKGANCAAGDYCENWWVGVCPGDSDGATEFVINFNRNSTSYWHAEMYEDNGWSDVLDTYYAGSTYFRIRSEDGLDIDWTDGSLIGWWHTTGGGDHYYIYFYVDIDNSHC